MDETRLDKIEIKELEVFANHGVYPEENVLGQKLLINFWNLLQRILQKCFFALFPDLKKLL